jgi:hypothetical protein
MWVGMFLVFTGAYLFYQATMAPRALIQTLWLAGGLIAATGGLICAGGFSLFGLIVIAAFLWIASLVKPDPPSGVNVQGLVFVYGAAAFVFLNLLIRDGKVSAALLLLPLILAVYGLVKFLIREYE